MENLNGHKNKSGCGKGLECLKEKVILKREVDKS